MAILHASQVVDFDLRGLDRDEVILEEDGRETERFDETYVRLFGPRGTSVYSLNGSHRAAGKDVLSQRESVAFAGEPDVALRYPTARDVRIVNYSEFITTSGKRVTPRIRWDEDNRVLRANQPVFGVATVEYQADYLLYLFRYRKIGAGCPLVPPEDPHAKFYETGLMVALVSSDVHTSLELTPPACQYSDDDISGIQVITPDRAYPKLVIEVDRGWRFNEVYTEVNPSVSPSAFRSVMDLRVYPGEQGITVTASPGSIKKRMFDPHVIDVEYLLTFEGTDSVELPLPRAGSYGISAEVLGTFRDQFGRTTSFPRILYPGDRCFQVTWTGPNDYRDPVPRVVGMDEICTASMGNNLLKYHGSIRVRYKASYNLYRYYYEWDRKQWRWLEGFVTASKGSRVGTLHLSPPDPRHV